MIQRPDIFVEEILEPIDLDNATREMIKFKLHEWKQIYPDRSIALSTRLRAICVMRRDLV